MIDGSEKWNHQLALNLRILMFVKTFPEDYHNTQACIGIVLLHQCEASPAHCIFPFSLGSCYYKQATYVFIVICYAYNGRRS